MGVAIVLSVDFSLIKFANHLSFWLLKYRSACFLSVLVFKLSNCSNCACFQISCWCPKSFLNFQCRCYFLLFYLLRHLVTSFSDLLVVLLRFSFVNFDKLVIVSMILISYVWVHFFQLLKISNRRSTVFPFKKWCLRVTKLKKELYLKGMLVNRKWIDLDKWWLNNQPVTIFEVLYMPKRSCVEKVVCVLWKKIHATDF